MLDILGPDLIARVLGYVGDGASVNNVFRTCKHCLQIYSDPYVFSYCLVKSQLALDSRDQSPSSDPSHPSVQDALSRAVKSATAGTWDDQQTRLAFTYMIGQLHTVQAPWHPDERDYTTLEWLVKSGHLSAAQLYLSHVKPSHWDKLYGGHRWSCSRRFSEMLPAAIEGHDDSKAKSLLTLLDHCGFPMAASLQSILRTTMTKGRASLFKWILEYCSSALSQEDKNVLLWESSGYSHADIVSMLIDMGAEVDHVSKYGGTTALARAASKGHLHIMELLTSKGADVQRPDVLVSAARSPCHSTMQFVLQHVTALERTQGALLAAVYNQNPEVLRLLLEAGAELGGSGENLLLQALQVSNEKVGLEKSHLT